MGGYFRVAVCLGSLIATQNAFALSITDHRRVTDHAIEEFIYCYPAFPDFYAPGVARTIQKANRNEDANLWRKWTQYSHFYHPYKRLNLIRYPSSKRVSRLGAEIGEILTFEEYGPNWVEKVHSRLGYLIHHIQDMSSPLHVVPVSHFTNDSFEGYRMGPADFPRLKKTQHDCINLRYKEHLLWNNPIQVLRETSIETLESTSEIFGLRRNSVYHVADWSYFWDNPNASGFGSYGKLGNRYGAEIIKRGRVVYEIKRETFKQFKRKRLRQAIEATKNIFLWFMRLRMRKGENVDFSDPELASSS